MKATLIIPPNGTPGRQYDLVPRLTAAGRASGLKVVRAARFCHLLNGALFQDLRDVLGAWIETDDVGLIAGALHLQGNEPGIFPLGQPPASPAAQAPCQTA